MKRTGSIYILLFILLTMTTYTVKKLIESKKVLSLFTTPCKFYGEKYGVSWVRIAAHIVTESSGNANATGKAGERGLMQISEGALADFNRVYSMQILKRDLFEADINIRVGTGYLAILLKELGSLDLASRAFNAGAGNVKKSEIAGMSYLIRIRIAETTIKSLI